MPCPGHVVSRDDPDNGLGLQTPRLGAFLSFSVTLQLSTEMQTCFRIRCVVGESQAFLRCTLGLNGCSSFLLFLFLLIFIYLRVSTEAGGEEGQRERDQETLGAGSWAEQGA